MCQPLMAEGEFALVKQHLEPELGKTSIWPGDHDLYAMLADAAVLQRDEAALRQYTPLADESARQCDHKLYQAIAHRAWGVAHRLAGEYAEAEARLNQALDVFSSLTTRWQIGRTLMELGELASPQRNIAQARDYFTRALREFEEMRAAPDAARTRASQEALG